MQLTLQVHIKTKHKTFPNVIVQVYCVAHGNREDMGYFSVFGIMA